MKHSESDFVTSDGLSLYYQQWLPETAPRAVLAVVHGLGEHSGRYAEFAAWFLPQDFAVCAFDHRGHGKSPGVRGHISHWSDFRLEIDAFLPYVREQVPDVPVFLVGHSMGGLIVLDYGLHGEEQVSGIVSSAPPLAQSDSISPLLITISKVLSSILPRLNIKTGLSADDLSHDPAVVQAYRDDPLVHGLATPRFGAEMDRTMKATLAGASTWPNGLPLLLLHGGSDPICPPVGSQQFFDRLTCEDKERRAYPGLLHEIFNEVGREQVLEDLHGWLNRQLA
ncbi:MAG: lysophospholipase [Anaerolineae bacterium]|nr:lysophospholipase [Anaerolineae bacterium]